MIFHIIPCRRISILPWLIYKPCFDGIFMYVHRGLCPTDLIALPDFKTDSHNVSKIQIRLFHFDKILLMTICNFQDNLLNSSVHVGDFGVYSGMPPQSIFCSIFCLESMCIANGSRCQIRYSRSESSTLKNGNTAG